MDTKDKKLVVIKSKEDLDKLKTGRWNLSPSTNRNIELKLQALSDKEKKDWESLLENAYNECGCKKGENFSFGGVVMAVLYIMIRFLGYGSVNARDVIIAVILIGGSALAGKVIGILEGRKRLNKSVEELKSKMKI